MFEMVVVLKPFTTLLIVLWILSGFVIQIDKWVGGGRLNGRARAVVRWLFLEIKPFFLSLITFDLITDALSRNLDMWDALAFALNVFNYYSMKNLDDDDRWKRRLEKLKSKIQVTDGKLAVVPATN